MSADWPKVKFSEIVDFRTGRLDSNRAEEGGVYPFFTCSPTTLAINSFAFDDEAVLLAGNNANGIFSVKYFNGKFNAYQRTYVITPKDKIRVYVPWLFFRIKQVTAELQQLSVGSATKFLTKKILDDFEVVLPSYNEQKSIADVLWSIENKIQLNHQLNQTLEEMAQAIFKYWFVDFEPVNAKVEAKANGQDPERAAMCAISGKSDVELDHLFPALLDQLRSTAALFPEELIDSEQGLIPKGWKVKKIEEVIKRFSVGGKYSQKTASEIGKVPILDQGKSGIIGYHNDAPGVKASLEDPIIVFANHTCYMRLVMHEFSAIQNVLPFKGEGLNIYWIFLATYGKQNFIEYKGHWPDFVINKIVVPNNSLDEKFGEYVACFFKEQFVNEKQASSLAELRDTLLPKLLSGEIDLQQIAV